MLIRRMKDLSKFPHQASASSLTSISPAILKPLPFDSSLDPDSNIMKRWEDSVYELTDHIPPSEESREEQIKWLDNVVEEFSNKFDFSAKIIESMESE